MMSDTPPPADSLETDVLASLADLTPPVLTPEEQVLAAINMEGLLQTLDELVRIPSLNGTAEEFKAQQTAALIMRRLGLTVDVWEFTDEQLQNHPAYSAEVNRPRALGVVGMMGDGEGYSLILNGHTDVVPAGDLSQWHYPPWQTTINYAEKRVYGRGTADMKGGLCCALYAAKAILDAGVKLNGKLLIQAVCGEEDGGIGTLAAIQRGYQADGAIIMEPTELMIAPAQAGAMNFRVTIPGLPAHGALRQEGVDPLEKFVLMYQAILTYEKVRNSNINHPLFLTYDTPYPICVGTIQGGTWASSVAESLTFSGRLGLAIGEDPAGVRTQFEQLVQGVAYTDPWLKEHPPLVEWWGGQFMPAEIPTTHPLVQTTSQAWLEATGRPVILRGMPYGADMRLLVNHGHTPTLLFGPGDVRRAHQFDEYVPVDDLLAATRTLALTILHFCGVKE